MIKFAFSCWASCILKRDEKQLSFGGNPTYLKCLTNLEHGNGWVCLLITTIIANQSRFEFLLPSTADTQAHQKVSYVPSDGLDSSWIFFRIHVENIFFRRGKRSAHCARLGSKSTIIWEIRTDSSYAKSQDHASIRTPWNEIAAQTWMNASTSSWQQCNPTSRMKASNCDTRWRSHSAERLMHRHDARCLLPPTGISYDRRWCPCNQAASRMLLVSSLRQQLRQSGPVPRVQCSPTVMQCGKAEE